MMQSSSRVVVFDLDDTLYKEVAFLKSAYREIAAYVEAAFPVSGVYDLLMDYREQGLNPFQRMIQAHGLDIGVADLLARYRNHRPSIALDQETRRLLDRLHDTCTLGLITDGRTVTQHNKIMALGLTAYIDRADMLISEATGYEKPSAVPFRSLMDRHPGCSYYYIGDNPAKDFIAPNRLGWTTVCLLDDGTNIHPQQFTVDPPLLPQYRINHISETEDIVNG